MRTFEPIYYSDPKKAMEDVRNGKIEGAVIIPPQYSRKVYEHDQPQIALVVDNSDNFMSAALEDEMTQITNALNNPVVEPRILQQSVLQIVDAVIEERPRRRDAFVAARLEALHPRTP